MTGRRTDSRDIWPLDRSPQPWGTRPFPNAQDPILMEDTLIPPVGDNQCKSLGWSLLLGFGNPRSWQACVPGFWSRDGFNSKPIVASKKSTL